ncbi:hypothetical protein JKF63_05629 [Porcisia hertigi]|uniref:Uncharacterized protein n=1 Tax=Porcisia hertigi TaxID=2761500 RepID=A0A836IGA6_9TRYP|nr:hypothetical protein JKF63_05629 [Porcisia hertigi]
MLTGTVAPGQRSRSEVSPLLTGHASRASLTHSTHSASSRLALAHDDLAVSDARISSLKLTSSTASSPLSIRNASQGSEASFGPGDSRPRHHRRTTASSSSAYRRSSSSGFMDVSGGPVGSGGGFVFGSPPGSLLELLGVFTHALRLQSWPSWLLGALFHLFHLLLILSFVSSPILYRSTIFSSQTMARALLEAQNIIEYKGNRSDLSHSGTVGHSAVVEKGQGGAEAAAVVRSGASQASVSVESVWAIHDSIFFLERDHVVMPTSIWNSFASLGSAGATSTGKSSRGSGMDVRHSDYNDVTASMNRSTSDDGTHAYVVLHKAGNGDVDSCHGGGTGGAGSQRSVVSATAVTKLCHKTGSATDDGGNQRQRAVSWSSDIDFQGRCGSAVGGAPVALRMLDLPPPLAAEGTPPRRRRAIGGRATLSNMIEAWEASPLYSSPLALTLFYCLYVIGCVVLLLTVTDGMLTGHFSVLRLCIALAEILWYIHHGAHAFVIYCWMLLLSHWPLNAVRSVEDAVFLQRGTPYALVSKKTGRVSMFLFYRAASAVDGRTKGRVGHGGAGTLLVDEIDLPYYLYAQVRYLKPLADVIESVYICLLSLCLVRDIHRVLDAVIGVRELMEPEGCVRCPLCGELSRVCEQHNFLRSRSTYPCARSGMVSWVSRTRWWWRWLRGSVRGSSGSHHAPTPRLPSPLWRWLLPSWCGGVPLKTPPTLAGTVGSPTIGSTTFPRVHSSDGASPTLADTIEDLEFYNESAVRRSAAAPQDTAMEEAMHLMRWLTVMPRGRGRSSMVRDGEHGHTRATGGELSSEDEESTDAMASSSSSEALSVELVRVVPTVASPKCGVGGVAAREDDAASRSIKKGRSSSLATRLVTPSTLVNDTRPREGRGRQHNRRRSQGPSQASLKSSGVPSAPQQHQRRRTRFMDEVLYWNYATRHVHHRCPKLYLDAQEATDDDGDDRDPRSGSDVCSSSSSSSEALSAVLPTTGPTPTSSSPALPMEARGRSVTDTPATTTSAHAHMGGQHTASDRARFHTNVLGRSLSPCTSPRTEAAEGGHLHPPQLLAELLGKPPGVPGKPRQQQQQQQQQRTDGQQDRSAAGVSARPCNYGTMGPDTSGSPSRLLVAGAPLQPGGYHTAQRGLYDDPIRDGERDFGPGNAFQSYDRAGWVSRLTFSWLNALLTFGLLEPTLLRQERFLPSLPVELLSLDNIAMPAWRLWVYRKLWFPDCVTKPGELLIPSNEVIESAGEGMSPVDLRGVDTTDETEGSDSRQTIVILDRTSLEQAAKFRPQRPCRCWQERVLWSLSAPLRHILVMLFYYFYIGTSRTVRRTRRRLVRELLKDRLTAAAEDLYNSNGDRSMEASEALEEAAWALGEVTSSCGSSAAAPSAGSALPTHMRRQLALSDVSLFYLFLEHSCGRRFLFVAAPLLLLSEVLTVLVVPTVELLLVSLQRVDLEIVRHRHEAPGDQSDVTKALLNAVLLGALLLLQGAAEMAYVSQAHQAAMEARTCVRAVVFEKTLALPLAQRTFTEAEVVTLATEEAACVATCLSSLHQTWSCPVRVALLSFLLAHYAGWMAAAVVGFGSLLTIPILRHASHRVRLSRQEAQEAATPRIALLQRTLGNMREVKAMLLEGCLARWLRQARAAEASCTEAVAMAEGTAGMLAGGTVCLLMVASLGTECILFGKEFQEAEVLVPVLVIFLLLTMPLLELPTLFTLVTRGFLSMKRIEAYLRQTPDEFVGTWVDLTSFTAMQQQLRVGNPRSALLKYRRGSVVCQDSSFTWQHNLTEGPPTTFLCDVDVCIKPGELVIVQGSMGAGKSTLLLCILGEVNRCVAKARSTCSSVAAYESESTLSVVSVTDVAACTGGAHDSARQGNWRSPGPAAAVACSPAPHTLPSNSSGLVYAAPPGIFLASPRDSAVAGWRVSVTQTFSAGLDEDTGVVQSALTDITERATAAPAFKSSRPPGNAELSDHSRGTSSKLSGYCPTGEHVNVGQGISTTCAPHHLADLEDAGRSTLGFLVFGSCAYCSEVPWLQNDSIRANIILSSRPPQGERWYHTVLRACALDVEVAALPQGDATVVGERGELLSLSMRSRIAIARAVYSKSHVYLMDSVLSPLEPDIQEHVIREVFHKLLRKKTVILASNVGLRSLWPDRVFSVVDGGVVREDTDLYRGASFLNTHSDEYDEYDEDALAQRRGSDRTRVAADGDDTGVSERGGNHSSSSSSTNDDNGERQATLVRLPPLYAEEFEEPQKTAEARGVFRDDPTVAATRLLFDGDAEFGPRNSRRHGGLVNRLDEGVPSGDLSLTSSVPVAGGGPGSSNGAAPRSPYFSALRPNSAAPLDSSRRGRASPAAMPSSAVLSPAAVSRAASCQSSTLSRIPVSGPSQPDADAGAARRGKEGDGIGSAREHSGQTCNTSAHSSGSSAVSNDQCVLNRCTQKMQREHLLRHRHRLSFFIFLRFMGGQVVWLLLTALLQQGTYLCIDIWVGVWPIIVAAHVKSSAAVAEKAATVGGPPFSRSTKDLVTSFTVTNSVFFGVVFVLCVLGMLLTLLRTRAMHVGVYGTMHFIYNQIVRRVLHSPASYFDRRIVALLSRVLRDDGEVSESRMLSTGETLLGCGAQVAVVVFWNTLVNPFFVLLLPVAVGFFHHIAQRHATVLREVRRLELSAEGGMIDILREVHQGAPTVRCMALQDRLREEFCRALDTGNTASMVTYSVDCWVELRLHVISTLSVCTAAIVSVIFTFSYSRPSLSAVAVIACLRVGPVLTVMCRSLSTFVVTEWISVQRLMSLGSVPQEPLCLIGEADLYTYRHVRHKAARCFVAAEGVRGAPLWKADESPEVSHMTRQAVPARQREAQEEPKVELCSSPEEEQVHRRRPQLQALGGVDSLPDSHYARPLSVYTDGSSLPSSLSSTVQSATGPRDEPLTSSTIPLIELRNVSARYQTTLPYVLRNVNLVVFPGERVGLVGHAGQGKKTFFNVLLRLVDVIEGGGVVVDGEDAARVPYPILRSCFGFLPQEPLLVQGSWRSNLLGYRPAHRLLISGANSGADPPFLPINTLARHQLQSDAQTPSATAAPTVTTQPASVAGERQPLLPQAAAARTRGGAGAAPGPEDHMGFLPPARHHYGSTNISQSHVLVSSGELTHLRLFDRPPHPSHSRYHGPTSADSCRQDGGSGGASTADTKAERFHDCFTPSQRRRRRSDPHQNIPPASASGGGISERHRCSLSSRGASSSEDRPRHSFRHVMDGSQRLVEDAVLWEALRAVGLDTVVEFDGGLDAPLLGSDSMVFNLTPSQRRLLCLARAVLNRPPILLLEDTVHSGAEAQTTDRVISGVLANELRESTVLIIAHRMSTALNLCTRVVAVQGGTLVPIADLKPTLATPVSTGATGTSQRALSFAATLPATVGLDAAVLEQLSYYLE